MLSIIFVKVKVGVMTRPSKELGKNTSMPITSILKALSTLAIVCRVTIVMLLLEEIKVSEFSYFLVR